MNWKATVILFCFCSLAIAMQAADISISPNGSDNNPGTKDRPMATVSMALRKAREMRRLHDAGVAGGIRIVVQKGTYQLQEPIFVRPEDSGTPESPTTIEAAPGEQPVFSGGINITGWAKPNGIMIGLPAAAQGKVWIAQAPEFGGRPVEFRQLWVNEQKAVRARDRNGDSMNRILSWNHQAEKRWI